MKETDNNHNTTSFDNIDSDFDLGEELTLINDLDDDELSPIMEQLNLNNNTTKHRKEERFTITGRDVARMLDCEDIYDKAYQYKNRS